MRGLEKEWPWNMPKGLGFRYLGVIWLDGSALSPPSWTLAFVSLFLIVISTTGRSSFRRILRFLDGIDYGCHGGKSGSRDFCSPTKSR
jgi:hypothetical protein